MPSWIFLQNLTSSFRSILTGVSPLFLLQVLALAISETRGGKPAQLAKRAFIESTGPCWMVFRALLTWDHVRILQGLPQLLLQLPVEDKKLWLARRPPLLLLPRQEELPFQDVLQA
ncbi:hypothetical protein OIU79_016723 [Salix purpurea]|nr:hypothetical protein OIU79_016723 [Salix purpurea]